MTRPVIYILIFHLIAVSSFKLKGQDTLSVNSGLKRMEIKNSFFAATTDLPDSFQLDDLPNIHFSSWEKLISKDQVQFKKPAFFKFVVRNDNNNPIEISLSLNAADSAGLFFFSNGELRQGEELYIRGLKLFGRINLHPGEIKELYFKVNLPDLDAYEVSQDLKFRLHNYSYFLEKEFSSRFIHSLLLGLLLFSAFLNLILGIILKRGSFISLFFYLLSLLFFSFSYLGFYDEFIIRKLIRIQI